MTAIRRRRTRSTVLALLAALAGIAGVAVMGIAGLRTLADSTAGRQAGTAVAVPVQRLPFTSTALVGVVDEDGRLTSVAVMALEADGTGGSIVGVAATADAGSGTTGTLAPLGAVLEVSGPDAFLQAVEQITNLSFDVVEVVDARRFAQLVGPLGDVTAVLPTSLGDASSGELWASGETVLSAPAAARALTATDPAIEDWYFEPDRASVWRAVAERVGAGIGSAAPVPNDEDLPVPANLDDFVDRLFAGPVAFRALSFTVIADDRLAAELGDEYRQAFGPDSVDAAVAHDPAELLMVLGAVAPGRIGAPLEAPNVRVVTPDLAVGAAELGLNRADVTKRAIDRLLFAKVNIVSVADLAGATAPDVTQIRVANPTVVAGVEKTYAPLFGEIEVSVADVQIEGVDIEIELGQSFIAQLASEPDG